MTSPPMDGYADAGDTVNLAQADPGGPGRTTIADRVVERIAAQAVAEVDRATGTARQLLGVSLGSTTATTPARVTADVDGGIVSVQVDLAVIWPNPVRAVTRQVRQHVTDRVEQLTGLQVAEVDVQVSDLLTMTSAPARVH
jgi:uncharacterized alkaline shock family protein YloU